MKVTIFWKTEFFGNIASAEVTLIDHGTRPYAQYSAAPFVTFKKKGGRKAYGIQQTYKPFICIVEGWNLDVKPDDGYKTVSCENGVTVKKSTYMSFDDRMVTDFENLLMVKNIKPLAVYK